MARGYQLSGKINQKLVANWGRLDVLQADGVNRLISFLARYSEWYWCKLDGERHWAWAKYYGPVPNLSLPLGAPEISQVDFPWRGSSIQEVMCDIIELMMVQ